MSAEGSVHLKFEGAAAFVTFDRPKARNAMTWSMYDQMAAAMQQIKRASDVRVVILRGAGGHFVAGTDINQFAAFESGEDGLEYERRLEELLAHLENLPVPTLAVVEGAAMGGGLALAAACDLRICTPNARFGVPIARTVGNTLTLANHARLVALFGASRTKAMIMTATPLGAVEARASGFVCDIVAPDAMDKRVAELVTRIVGLAPVTLRATKALVARTLRAMRPGEDDAVLREVYGSRDFQEGVAAFLEKRDPRWEGR